MPLHLRMCILAGAIALLWNVGCSGSAPKPLGLFPDPVPDISEHPLPQPEAAATKAFLTIFLEERSEQSAKSFRAAATRECQQYDNGRTVTCIVTDESPYGGSLRDDRTARVLYVSEDGKHISGTLDQRVTMSALTFQAACGAQFLINGILGCHFEGTLSPSTDGALIEEDGNCHTSENPDQLLVMTIDDASHSLGFDLTVSHRLRLPAQGGPVQVIERSVDGVIQLDHTSYPYRALMQQPAQSCAVQERLLRGTQ